MSFRRKIARNAFWSAAGMASGMITGFISAPFLVHHLGKTTYGLWIVIVALTNYFNLIDLGLRGSITRHVAFFRAKNDQVSVNAILSTAQALLAAAGVVTVIATVILLAVFTRYGDVSPQQWPEARLALLLSGITVAITLAMSVFDATLWGYERFDLLNGIEITNDIVETAVLLFLVWHGGSIVTVAAVVLICTLCSEIAKAAACFYMDRNLRIAPTRASKWAARELFGFGLWKFLWSVGNRGTMQSGPLVIWLRLSADVATPYSVASRLVVYAKGLSSMGTGILTPTATALHANEQHDKQETLFIEGTKYCMALGLFTALGVVLLGKTFITCWMGAALASSAGAATVLAVGEILPMSQWVTNSILLGRDRHRVAACASFIETFVVIGVGLIVARTFGLEGVCIAIAIPGTVCRGVLPLIYGCRVLDVPIWKYIRQSMLPPLVAVAIPFAAMAMLVYQRPAEGWVELFCYGSMFSFAFLVTSCLFVAGPRHVRSFAGSIKASLAEAFPSKSEVAP